MKTKEILILFAFLSLTSISFAQNENETKKAIKYIESTIKFSNKLIVNNTSQTVLKSDILEGELLVNIGDPYNDALIIHSYFIKTKNEFIPFESRSTMLSSSEFKESIKKKKFKLKTEEDGIAFQSLLCKLDKEQAKGFFQIDNIWYFIRTKFFDDITAYEITTDKKNHIISVKYNSRLKIKIPEVISGVGKKLKYENNKTNIVSKEDSVFIHNYLLKNTDFTFEVSNFKIPNISNISTASFYKCSLKYSEKYSDGSEGSSEYPFLLIKNSEKYNKCRDGKNIIESKLFLESVKNKFKLKTKDNAKTFQEVIDVLSPVDKSFREFKRYYLQDGIWFFLRDKSFDDLYAYMLKIDEKGTIKYLDYSTIKDEDILSFKMKDPNFKVDYKFKLITPINNSIIVNKGENIKIQINFDAKMVNAKGAWIGTRFDGKGRLGVYAGTSIESPYTDKIPSKFLTNKKHTIEYFLLKSGGTDIENALGKIKIEIEVK